MLTPKVLRTALTSLFAFVCGLTMSAQISTITDEHGIIYDVKSGTNTVTVSASNNGLSQLKDVEVDVVIPKQVRDNSSSGSSEELFTVVEMAANAFMGCSGIVSIDIQAEIPKIASFSFKGCSKLRTAKLPDSIERIESSAFRDCAQLQTVSGFSNLTYFRGKCFRRV